MPKVSVIIPCFNSERYVGKTIASVRAQTLTDWEQIVVDDGSPDGSERVVEAAIASEPRGRLVRKDNGGVATARNAGAAAMSAQSEYILFLDADDVLEPKMLTTLVGHLDQHPDVGMVYCACRLIDRDGNAIPLDQSQERWFERYTCSREGRVLRIPKDSPLTPFDAVYTAGVLLPSVTLIRRSVYEHAGGFDESFGHVFEDADLFRRMALLAKVHYLDLPLVNYRRHGGQSTADAERFNLQKAKLERKWRALTGLTRAHHEQVRAAQWFHECRLVPYFGKIAAKQKLRDGQFVAAARFFGGAVRREFQALFKRPKA